MYYALLSRRPGRPVASSAATDAGDPAARDRARRLDRVLRRRAPPATGRRSSPCSRSRRRRVRPGCVGSASTPPPPRRPHERAPDVASWSPPATGRSGSGPCSRACARRRSSARRSRSSSSRTALGRDGAVRAAERERGDLALRCSAAGGPGPAPARNAGWRAARGRWIAFTDDDCEATPGWLETALARGRGQPGAVVQGPTLPIPRELALLGPFARTRSIEAAGAVVRDLQHRLRGGPAGAARWLRRGVRRGAWRGHRPRLAGAGARRRARLGREGAGAPRRRRGRGARRGARVARRH